MFRPIYFIVLIFFSAYVNADNKIIIGEKENIAINENQIHLIAKIDTGADSSSLGAKILETYKKNNELWVKFEVIDSLGQSNVLDRKVIRHVKIKRKKSHPLDNSIKRPIINLDICLGSHYQLKEVNLSNRSNFKFPFLIGKKFLRGKFIVDVEKSLTQTINCH